MAALIVLLAVMGAVTFMATGYIAALRTLPRMLARMSSTDRERLLDQVEAAERGTD